MKRFFMLVYLLCIPFMGGYVVDADHFWAAAFLPPEPRLIRPWMFTNEVLVASGRAQSSLDQCGCCAPLLDLDRKQILRNVGNCINEERLSPSVIDALASVESLPSRPPFGSISVNGIFRLVETHVQLIQNFDHGYFFRISIPIRSMQIFGINYIDESPATGFPNRHDTSWKIIFNHLPEMAQAQGLCFSSWSQMAAGDIAFMFGWGINYQNTRKLDYVDFDIQIGVLTPSGALADPRYVFSLPTGNNGHIGLPFQLDLSVGVFQWLTFGFHGHFLYLFPGHEPLRADCDQGAWVSFKKVCAEVHPRLRGAISGYIKADHCYGGLSFLFGYQFNAAQRAYVWADTKGLLTPIHSSQPWLQQWHMHTFHFWSEYDFATRRCPSLPRIAIFYNHIISGKRIFNTNMIGGQWGVELCWRY
jgi:hypothetical protein